MDDSIHPFQIAIPDTDLDDLAGRLGQIRWPDQLPGSGWDHGVELGYLSDLAGYWRTGYDWRAHEAALNELPQFTTHIDGQHVHFAHVRSDVPDAVPLLITHGWPSTIADFLAIVGPLTDPAGHGAPDAPAFHVITPSLPGFGFSGPTTERGWDVHRIAQAWATLMARLGYDRYLVQGGDFGGLISPEVGRVDPEHVIGVHVNALVTAVDWRQPDPTAGLTDFERQRAFASGAQWQQRAGYATVQSTRPQTLAYALTDSPIGLLGWNLEWFVDYDPGRTVQVPIDRDAILTDVTICWLTRTAGSSARL
jgi:pimeloyl-ACP methyl ester carboxylesterase